MNITTRCGIGALLTLTFAAPRAAQELPCQRNDIASLPAPVASLQRMRPADGVSRFSMTIQGPRDVVAKPLGSMTVTQGLLTCGGVPALARIIIYDYGAAGKVVDTTLSVAETLAPILERTRKSTGDIVLDFSHGLVTGSLTRSGVTRQLRDTLVAPAFNSTDLELVVRSLALRSNFSTVIQIYDPEYGGFRPDSISVVKLERPRDPESQGVWTVRSRDRRLESIYYIAEPSRQLLGIDVQADSTRYHIFRVSPAQ